MIRPKLGTLTRGILRPFKTRRRAVDSMAYTVGVAGNFAIVPQIIKAWQSKAPGLAIMTWLLFMAIGCVWMGYAIQHRQRPLIIAQAVCISCDLAVVLGWVANNWFR